MTSTGTDQVHFERRGALGLVTLDRPRVLNALTAEMIEAFTAQLTAWAVDDAIATVAVRGAGDRGLCAGGDVAGLVRALRDDRSGTEAMVADFFRLEYRLNHAVSSYPKPYVALMDGIVLGGGVGISAHGSHRVVTERSRVGMPETGIGLFPDVGGTHLLAHAPDGIGMLMGLTGTPVGPGDAIHAGFADVFVPSDRLDDLLERLETEHADEAIAAVRAEAPAAELAAVPGCTRRLLEAANVVDAVAALREVADGRAATSAAGHGEPDEGVGREAALAREALETIAQRSPTSLAITFEAIRRAAEHPDLAATLVMDYRLICRLALSAEFAEGVRAQLIDKDRAPRWSPASLDEVDLDGVDALFAPLDGGDLTFETAPGAS